MQPLNLKIDSKVQIIVGFDRVSPPISLDWETEIPSSHNNAIQKIKSCHTLRGWWFSNHTIFRHTSCHDLLRPHPDHTSFDQDVGFRAATTNSVRLALVFNDFDWAFAHQQTCWINGRVRQKRKGCNVGILVDVRFSIWPTSAKATRFFLHAPWLSGSNAKSGALRTTVVAGAIVHTGQNRYDSPRTSCLGQIPTEGNTRGGIQYLGVPIGLYTSSPMYQVHPSGDCFSRPPNKFNCRGVFSTHLWLRRLT